MPYSSLLPAIRDVLTAIRQRKRVDEVVELILERACGIAAAVHGSFVTIDPIEQRLSITNTFGSDWTLEKQYCRLKVGEGLTGKVAQTGVPYMCGDVMADPSYFPLFDYVRSELIVPVIVEDRVWGLINLDGLTPHAFDDRTLSLLTVFAELASFAITLRLELNEQERLQKKLLQSEKLASLGETIAGIAHEINNPLTSILGHASLLTLKRGGPADAASVQAILAESRRAADLVKSLLEFSRKETGKREVTGTQDIIRQVVNLKKYQLKVNSVQLIVAEDTSYPVSVCPQQIQQVLINLVNNAEQSIPRERSDGLIRITTACENGRVQIAVVDNGKGIPLEAQKFIFDPFYTTKGPGDGTGLGLSIAYSIMDAHGGSIYLSNSGPIGSTFVLELPLAVLDTEAPLPPPPEPEPVTTNGRMRGKILLVDDEPQILESLAAYLQMQKIEVQRAGDAQTAINILKEQSFDLVISDIRMPGMDGLELYQQAKAHEPRYEKNFIFMSGYLMRDNVRSFLTTTGCKCLEKPFSFDDLRKSLADFLQDN